MTRSVEIPEAAVEAAIDVVMDDGHNGIQCAPDRNLAVTVRAALEAARPHIEAAMCNCPTDAGVTSAMRTETGQHLATCRLALYRAALPYPAPALESEVVSWHRKEGYEAGLSARPAEATHTYGNGTHYPPTGGTHVTERCGPKCPPAPAGDGGLREALTELAKERDSVSGHTPGDYSIRPYELFDLLKAHPATPAVPQPVDREANPDAVRRCPARGYANEPCIRPDLHDGSHEWREQEQGG